ncbi:hypothetical protein EDB84DRAFT_1575085 [Lactarius hengduanensis]|nr:hypothetical protein EDB84DRAFT_1575085 [Lactarius hengduanensis]
MGDMGFQASENQGQWQFNGTGNGAITRQNTFGIQGTQNTDVIVSMVAGASEAILERNAFYMGLKTVASNRAIEMEGLKGTIDQKNQEIVDRDKQINLLKARCDTLEGTIDKFARDYHTLDGTGGDGGQITFLTDLGLMPTPWKRDEHPEVTLWMKREWARVAKALALAHKGESSRDSPDVAKAKPKVGRPSKKDQEDADHKYLYLQGRDGVKISAEKVSKMSIKAKSVWDFLHSKKMAPPQFGKMEWPAWDLYARAMLTDPEFDFLLLCDDATWKLREWTIQNYSSWAGNRGIRPKNTGEKTQKTVKDKDVLDDPSLVRMKSGDGSDDGINDTDDSIQPAGHVSESDDNRINVMTPEPEDAGFPEADDASEENPGPSAQSAQTRALEGHSRYLSSSFLAAFFFPNTPLLLNHPLPTNSHARAFKHVQRSVLAILGDANTHSKPPGPNVPKENPGSSTQSPQGLVQSVIANPFAPTASSSFSGTHTGATTTNPTIAPASSAPAQTHAATNILGAASTATATAATTETHISSDDPPRSSGTTPGGSDTTATTNEASPPRPRIVLKFGPLAKSTVAQGNQDPVASPVPSEPTQTPTACPSDIQTAVPVHTSPPPIDAPIPNLRLERAMANQEKKRKAEGKTTAATSKKQKTATTLAEPTGTITINGTNSNQAVKVSPPTSTCTSRGYLTQTKRDSKQRCVSPKPPRGKRRRPPRSPAKRHRSTDRVCAGHASQSPIPHPLPSCCLSRAPQPLDPSRSHLYT